MADWSRRFFDPIDLPGGRQLATLRDAANYVTALSAIEHDQPHWRSAIEVLILSAEHGQSGADPMFARIAMLSALNAGRSSEPPPPRHKAPKKYKLVK